MADDNLDSLRIEWTDLYTKTLPKLARAKDSAQTRWPVTLDHCFARIILDNTVGRGVLQWDKVIKKPAVKNMDEVQLSEAIKLGKKIQKGQVDLVDLDQKSLQARGKGEKKYKGLIKRKQTDSEAGDERPQPSPKKMKQPDKVQSTLSFAKDGAGPDASRNHSSLTKSSGSPQLSSEAGMSTSSLPFPNPNTAEFLVKIQNHAGLTPYRKRLYSTLLSVPPGDHTTYQAMATFLDSSARAVGNGMRNNPFAPDVPCHRVLASDGSIGGFHGSWGEEGKFAREKRDLLKSEGVYFDSKGKVKGPVFRNFEDLSTRSIS